jgi:hypothetical protein
MIPITGTAACPVCGQPTDSLKQYRYINWCVFFGAAIHQTVVYRACPACMRKFIWKRCLINIVPANLVWLIGLLPWGLILIAGTYLKGHSALVKQGLSPEMALARERAAEELSISRVLAVLAMLLFWLPILGLVVSGLAYLANRRSNDWLLPASRWSFIGSVVVHLLLIGVFLVKEFDLWR